MARSTAARTPMAAIPTRSSSTSISCWTSFRRLDSTGAAPLLCAGITTWSPLRHWKAGPGRKSASSASAGSAIWPSSSPKRWAHMSSLSPHRRTRAPTPALGADEVVISTDEDDGGASGGSFDLVSTRCRAPHDLDAYHAAEARWHAWCWSACRRRRTHRPHVGPLIFKRRSPGRLADRRHRRRPRRCWISAPSMASPPTSR